VAQGQAARRREYLDEIADAALAEFDASEARKVELSEAEAVSEEERLELTAELDRLVTARMGAIASAEIAAGTLVDLFSGILDAAAAERLVRSKLKATQIAVNQDHLIRRLSGYLSDELTRLTGPQVTRFGHLSLARHFPLGGRSWVEDEAFRTGVKMEKVDE
jgi:hypothetical protein